jgi:hypothetical protein
MRRALPLHSSVPSWHVRDKFIFLDLVSIVTGTVLLFFFKISRLPSLYLTFLPKKITKTKAPYFEI